MEKENDFDKIALTLHPEVVKFFNEYGTVLYTSPWWAHEIAFPFVLRHYSGNKFLLVRFKDCHEDLQKHLKEHFDLIKQE